MGIIQLDDAPCPIIIGLVHRATKGLSRNAVHEYGKNLDLIEFFACYEMCIIVLSDLHQSKPVEKKH